MAAVLWGVGLSGTVRSRHCFISFCGLLNSSGTSGKTSGRLRHVPFQLFLFFMLIQPEQ